MSSSGASQDLGAAYQQYTPTLFRALGALAKNGFVVPPSEALDLIHDFFLEGWPSVRTHYNPKKGPLPNYVYVSFVHYARPRIVKLIRLRNALVGPEVLEHCEGEEADPNRTAELERWTAAIVGLPERERRFLQEYLHASRGSERKLAEATGLSRYVAREELIRILAKVIATFGRGTGPEPGDWRVAEAIWLKDRTIAETAALLDMTPEAVKRAKARNIARIVEALRRFESKRGGSVMASAAGGGKAPIAPETLLYQALTNPGNQALLTELRTRASEIVRYLEGNDFVLPQAPAESVGELWIAEVYEAIASGAEPAAAVETEQFARELFRASEEDQASIGVAFKEVLMPDLPVQLTRFDEWFGGVPAATPAEIQRLSEQADVKTAFPISAQLIVYGTTPSMLYYATEAVSGLLQRLMRSEMLHPPFVLKPNTPLEVKTEAGLGQVLPEDEVDKVTECGAERAAAMTGWLFRAAEYKPALFSGFEADFANHKLVLKPSRETYANLYQRWGMAFARP